MRHSEVMIAVNPETEAQADGFHDSDAIMIYNGRAISQFHVMRICDHRFQAPRSDVSGLLVGGDHFEDYFFHTHRFRFRRVAYDEIEKFNLQTRESKIVTSVKDADGEFCKVAKFVRNRRLRRDHRLFGSIGREVWYGGLKDYSDGSLSTMWGIIEGATSERESNNESFPHSSWDMRKRLVLALEDMSDVEAQAIIAVEFDNPIDPLDRRVIRKRRRRITFRSLPGLGAAIADIENRGKRIDLRGRSAFTRAQAVALKEVL